MAENGLKWKCQNPKCGLESEASWGPWKLEITGAVKALCPACNTVSTFIGIMGQNVQFHRMRDDVADQMRDEQDAVDEVGMGDTTPIGDPPPREPT